MRTVIPTPGFVIKTSDESGNKVFLNVCADAAVPLPDGWSPGEPLPPAVKGYLEAGPEGSAPSSGDALMSLLAFPMWLSDLRRDSDHTGAACGVLDCVLHADILRHAAEVRPLKLYAIQLVLSEVAHKCALRLNPLYKLPRMRYKGQGPVPHAVPAAEALTKLPQEQPVLMPGQGAERPGLVREVLAGRDKGLALRTTPTPRPAARERSEACEESADPSTTLQAKLRYHGCPVEAVSVEVALTPALVATAQRAVHAVRVTVTGQRVSIALPACPALEVGLPFFVRPEQGTARVTAQGLHVTLPYRPLEEVHPRTA